MEALDGRCRGYVDRLAADRGRSADIRFAPGLDGVSLRLQEEKAGLADTLSATNRALETEVAQHTRTEETLRRERDLAHRMRTAGRGSDRRGSA